MQTMQNLRNSQLDTDAKWAAILEEYREKINLLRAEGSKIQDGYNNLKQQYDEMALNHGGTNVDDSDVLDISAGGKIITVTRGTLTQLQGTCLAALFSGRWENRLQKDGKGRIFLDVNPSCFKSIVDYLNERSISPPDAPMDPPFVEKDDEVSLDRLLKILGMDELCRPALPALNTTTLTDTGHAKALRSFLSEDEVHGELKLLYRGSRDGFGASDFHAKCDRKGPTVTVIKDVGGYLFGGFTDQSWKSDDGGFSTSNKTFLFSLHCHSGLAPTKFRLKEGEENHSMWNASDCGPTFGANDDIYVANQSNNNTESEVDITSSYQCPPGQISQTFITGNSKFKVSEIEVFCLSHSRAHNGPRKRKRDSSTTQSRCNTMPWETLTFDEGFPDSMKTALEAEQKMLTKANEDLQELKHAFQQEKRFVEFFVLGEAMDIITLNVSGELMSIKRATLSIYKESVLAKQFNDPLRVKEADDTMEQVKSWGHDKVATWISNIDGLSKDTVETLNKINGAELLALDCETLKFFGITRPATLALLTKKITELQMGDHRRGVLIEQDAYCFGKILDHLRLRAMCNALQDTTPLPPPTIRESYQKRFKRIVKYYFPSDSASFE